MQVTAAGSTNSVFHSTDTTIDPLADLSNFVSCFL